MTTLASKAVPVAVVREAIGKIVTLLTRQRVKVTQRGSRAYVQYNTSSGEVELLNLPYIPDDASPEFIAAVQGFLDHEVGHVLFTDSRISKKMKAESAKVRNLTNAIEDVFIEKKMSAAFAGSVHNLDTVRRFHIDSIAKPKIEEALASGNLQEAMGYAGVVAFRAWGGQKVAQDFFKDNPRYAELVKPLQDKLGAELIEAIKRVNSTSDSLALARKMAQALAEPEEEKPVEKDKPKEKDKGKGEADEGDPGDAGKSSDSGEGSGKGKGKKDPKEDSDPDAEPDADQDENDQDEQESVEREPSDDEAATPKGEGDERGEDGKDSDSDEDVDGGGPKMEEWGDDETAEDADDEGGGLDGDAGEGATEVDASVIAEAFDKDRDFDGEVSEALTHMAAKEIHEAEYAIFSTDWDTIEPGPAAERPESVTAMLERVQPMIGGLQKGLERALAAKAQRCWNPGMRKGRINPGALFRTAVGNDRIFRQRYETQARNTAVSLLVDCSGSMRAADRIGTAGLAAYALSSTLERLCIAHEVIGFTTTANRDMVQAMHVERGVRFARTEALYMPVFKGFEQRLDASAKSRIAALTEHPGWLRENVDGECVQIAAKRLLQQRAERHVMIVLSDGSPACPGNWAALSRHLKTSVQRIEAAGVEVIGIGIQTNSVKEYYSRHIVLNDLSELPTAVVSQLSKVLLAA